MLVGNHSVQLQMVATMVVIIRRLPGAGKQSNESKCLAKIDKAALELLVPLLLSQLNQPLQEEHIVTFL